MTEGWTVGVAARRTELLSQLGAAAVEPIDVTKEEATEHLQALIQRLGGMVLGFVGYHSTFFPKEKSFHKDLTNAEGPFYRENALNSY